MKKIAITALLVLLTAGISAVQYETPLLDMTVPSGLTDNSLYFNFGHKFGQPLNDYPSNNSFALLKNGATLNLALRYMVWNGIEAKAAYDSLADEKNIGLSYARKFPELFFSAQADLQFFSYDDPGRFQTAKNFFYLISLQSVPLVDNRFTIAVDAGYDGYFDTTRFALGISAEVIKDVALVFEYYPQPPALSAGDGDGDEDGGGAAVSGPAVNGCYSIGIKYATYGHQFMLKFGNSTAMETRTLMQGTTSENIYVGISIMRLVDFMEKSE